jgi:hypothetical protein
METVKENDVIKFKNKESIYKNYPRCGWVDRMDYLCGQLRILTEETARNINENKYDIWTEKNNGDAWYISSDMIELIGEIVFKRQ